MSARTRTIAAFWGRSRVHRVLLIVHGHLTGDDPVAATAASETAEPPVADPGGRAAWWPRRSLRLPPTARPTSPTSCS